MTFAESTESNKKAAEMELTEEDYAAYVAAQSERIDNELWLVQLARYAEEAQAEREKEEK
jgi:hypothetical protein